MLLLLFAPQGTPASELDTANSVGDAYFRLGFQGAADIAQANSWVTVVELFQWADELVKEIAYRSGVFLTLDVTLTAVAATPVYALAGNNVFVDSAWLNNAPLRITAVSDLWALDANWAATNGVSTRASMDAGGAGTLTLYPNPTAGGPIALIAQEYPAVALAVGASAIALPTPLVDMFTDVMIGKARGKESEAAMADVAGHMDERVKLYMAVIDKYYGSGE